MNTRWKTRYLLATLLALPAAGVQAHLGGEPAHADFLTGLMHPLSGLDHLLAAFAAGLLAVRLGMPAYRSIPLVFLAMLGLGAWGGFSGIQLPVAGSVIALSVLVFGVLLASRNPIPGTAALALVATFAVFQGNTHALALPAEGLIAASIAGLIAMTGMLLAIGIMTGHALQRSARPHLLRIGGSFLAASGLVFLSGFQ